MGGMSAFIPSRKDAAVNENALSKVREDKERECRDGFDGTWVAHPDLVPVAMGVFDRVLGAKPNQKEKLREEVSVEASQLIDFRIPGGAVTDAGIRNNINVALQYLESWLRGLGAVAIHNLMEDAATAEISRAELWQWIKHGVLSAEKYKTIRTEELKSLGKERFEKAASLLDSFVLTDQFDEFLTLSAYREILDPSIRISLSNLKTQKP